MKTIRLFVLATLCSAAILALVPAVPAADDPKKVGPEAKEWDKLVDKGIGYLKSKQAADGTWSKDKSPGVTGICLTGLLQTGKVTAKDPVAEKALKSIEGLVNRKEGHIAGADPKVQLKNYVTCVNVMALQAADRDSYKEVVGDAVKFLKQLQWDEGEGKDKNSDFYGGAGYDSSSRPDLSNTQFFLDALVAAGVPKDDPAMKKALVFIGRCQNIKDKEVNDQPWADKIDDGSFIYSAAGGGATKVQDKPDDNGGLPGYGSMTYAGVKSMIYCGVTKDDARMKKALEWLKKNYSVEHNPGMPTERAKWGLFYYFHTMAKTLDVLGVDFVEDAKGVKHDWRAEITAELAKLQKEDGSWVGDPRWMEGDPNLITGYALMTLGHCKAKK
jgi:squalene-hopene/tetraprenyl-beta-curcumene cyclase